MRGSNAEIVWRRARATRRRSAALLKVLYSDCHVKPDTSKKRALQRVRPLCSIAVRARQTVTLKIPQVLDNATSNYRYNRQGPTW